MPQKARQPVVKAKTIAEAWESLAANDSLAGMTLTQYRNKVQAAQDSRDERDALLGQLRAKREEIIANDAVANLANKQVVAAVRGNPNHGSDSPLLAAMNYVTDSMKKSGKTNKNGNGNGNGNSQPH